MISPILHNVLVFGRVLRRLGVDVPLDQMLDTVAALQHIDIGARDEFYDTCRAFLTHRHEHLPVFDRAFEAFWTAESSGGPSGPPADADRRGGSSDPRSTADVRGHEAGLKTRHYNLPLESADLARDEGQDVGMWSDAAGLAAKDFGTFTSEELRVARLALDRLTWTPGVRRTRRWTIGDGARLDLRAALRHSRRTGGEVVHLPRRGRLVRPRALVLICDVSGSMERYSRMLIHFAHALGARGQRLEAFLFGTTLTRITMPLRARRAEHALAAVSRAVTDWSGGTRIGESLRQFHQRWARRVLHASSVVLLVSDGWDRGDPSVLRDEVARLQRRCHRLIWLNPLIGSADYAPLTRGLQAALPFVDDFLPVRTLTDLVSLADHLNALENAGRRYNQRH